MRKLHQVALVFAAAGGLSAIGTGASQADPVGYNGYAGPPVSQQDPQAASWSASQATSHASGPQGYAPQGGAPDAGPQSPPQVNPQFNPDITPELSPTIGGLAQQAADGPHDQNNRFGPTQECSPQTLLNAAAPVGVLGAAQDWGTVCTQHNAQANAVSGSGAHS
ncbi:hypothetical protein ACFY12_25340 [Streptomyces sp. NPDC001339]|uniref:hypothetical protein n=1 Tax=Streptomyces sp. NPDC001339 TaxID=3364563 RepID=UPI0036BFC822